MSLLGRENAFKFYSIYFFIMGLPSFITCIIHLDKEINQNDFTWVVEFRWVIL